MNKPYKTIAHYGEDEIIINKSRFVGYANPIENEEDALSFINEIKVKNKDSTHNVFAYVLGEESQIQRFNDDGEPSGTAGIPVLEVIKKGNLKNVVVVVTRYFGGIKLGSGGLIRAYTKGSKIALDKGQIVDMMSFKVFEFEVQYTTFGKIENYLKEQNYCIDEVHYLEDIKFKLSVSNNSQDLFLSDMLNLTSGSIKYRELDKIFLPTINGVRYTK